MVCDVQLLAKEHSTARYGVEAKRKKRGDRYVRVHRVGLHLQLIARRQGGEANVRRRQFGIHGRCQWRP